MFSLNIEGILYSATNGKVTYEEMQASVPNGWRKFEYSKFGNIKDTLLAQNSVHIEKERRRGNGYYEVHVLPTGEDKFLLVPVIVEQSKGRLARILYGGLIQKNYVGGIGKDCSAENLNEALSLVCRQLEDVDFELEQAGLWGRRSVFEKYIMCPVVFEQKSKKIS